MAYWSDLAAQPVTSMSPGRSPGGYGVGDDMRFIEICLDEADTSKLIHQSNAAYKTQINELLLSALFIGLSRGSGLAAFRVDLEGHGRELAGAPDLSETVGWFTTVYPLLLTAAPGSGVDEIIRITKQYMRAVPNNGVGFGILSELSGTAGLQQAFASARSEVLFNYLGRFEQEIDAKTAFGSGDEHTGADMSAQRQRQYLLEVNGSVQGRSLVLWLSYNQHDYLPPHMQALGSAIKEGLQSVISQCQSALAEAKRHERNTLLLKQETFSNSTVNYLHFNQGWGHWATTTAEIPWLAGAPDLPLLEQALSLLVEKYAALRLQLRRETGSLLHYMLPIPDSGTLLEFEDLSGVNPADVDEVGTNILSKWKSTLAFDDGSYLFRFVYMQFPAPRNDCLYLIFHHMIIDGASNGILKDELLAIYRQLETGFPGIETEPVSYPSYLRTVVDEMDAVKAADVAFWKNLRWDEVADLDEARSPASTCGNLTTSLVLDESDAASIFLLRGRDGGSLAIEAVMFALVYGIHPWLTNNLVLFEMVMNNRQSSGPSVDTAGIVGNLTTNNIFPLDTSDDFLAITAASLRNVAAQRRTTPNEGRGLLHWLYSDSALLPAAYRPLIGVNVYPYDQQYVPQPAPTGAQHHSPWLVRDDSNPNIHALFFQVVLFSNTIQVSSYINDNRCSPNLQHDIMERIKEAFRQIAAV